jgi:hypothetical protein
MDIADAGLDETITRKRRQRGWLVTEQTLPRQTDNVPAYNRSLPMFTKSRRTEPYATANASSNSPADTMSTSESTSESTSDREMKSLKLFPVRLKTAVRWVKRFLHGAK